MVWVTNFIYCLIWLLFSPVILWQNLTGGKKRSGWSARILGRLPQDLVLPKSDSKVIWLHGVSVGEINLLTTLIPTLQQELPDHDFYISASTDSGLELAKKKFPPGFVFRCPWDFSWAVKNVLRKLNPKAIVLAELEIWPNWIRLAKQNSIPITVINGRLSEKSHQGYRRWGFLSRPIFQSLDLVCCQTEDYANRFRDLGTESQTVFVTGSMKFDAIGIGADLPKRAKEFEKLMKINDDQFVFLAGSTSDPEEEISINSFLELQKKFPNVKMILVPRHPERFEGIAQLCKQKVKKFVRRSEIQSPDQVPADWELLLVDSVGELRDWWALANAGFVGGSMGKRGGQSMIEPASYGVPCCFGPNTKNFKDVVDLLLPKNAAKVVRGQEELFSFLQEIYSDKKLAAQIGNAAKDLAKSQTGATAKTVTAIREIL